MLKIFVLASFVLTSIWSAAQSGPITPQLLQKIKADVEKQAIKFRSSLGKSAMTANEIEFAVDTFKLQRLADKRMAFDYSTRGMNSAVDELTQGYDRLMNVYYNRLLKILEGQDKKALITAQRAWLNFRDVESKLIATLAKTKYTGGGSIQSNIAAGSYADMVIKRAERIFNYYNMVAN